MGKIYNDTKYLVGTTIGKPLYIKREPKVNQKSDKVAEYVYSLTENVVEATKCINKTTAETLIEYYENEKHSGKSFAPMKLKVTYELEEERHG